MLCFRYGYKNPTQKTNGTNRQQLFKKQVDKLQTDHQGTFVLKDSNFRWTSRYAEGEWFRACAAVFRKIVL